MSSESGSPQQGRGLSSLEPSLELSSESSDLETRGKRICCSEDR